MQLWTPPLTAANKKYQYEALLTSSKAAENAIAKREKYKGSLYRFFLESWHILEPATELQVNWHMELICEYLELVHTREIQKLLINIAPRHLKSRIISVAFPAWEWLDSPSLTQLCCSYVSNLANDLSDDRRTLIQSDWYRSLFPELSLSSSKNRITEFQNNYRGEMSAKGLEAGVTGKGGLSQIYDDPNDPNKVESPDVRDRTQRRYRDYSVTRRNDPKKYAIIVVQQRTHEEDISGYIKKNDPEFVHINLPTEAEEDEVIIFPKSGRQIIRKKGDLLHPERFGEKEVAEAKKTLGAYMYAARHQQRPIPLSGGILKERYWNYCLSPPPAFQFKLWSWDTGFKEKTQNDPSAGILFGLNGNRIYVLDVFCDRLDYPDLKKQIIHLHEREQTNVIVIEDKASGQSLIQDLKKKTTIPVTSVKLEGDKMARTQVISPSVEAGRFYLPHNAPWLADFISETSLFPRAKHDDRVDAFVYGAYYLVFKYITDYEKATAIGKKRKTYGMHY